MMPRAMRSQATVPVIMAARPTMRLPLDPTIAARRTNPSRVQRHDPRDDITPLTRPSGLSLRRAFEPAQFRQRGIAGFHQNLNGMCSPFGFPDARFATGYETILTRTVLD